MPILQSLKENWEHYSEQFKILLFGENNSRLDRVINRYYSMRAEKRTRVKLISMIAAIAVGILIIALYFYGLYKTQSDLNNATNAYIKIEEFKPRYMQVQQEYVKISSDLAQVNEVENLNDAILEVANKLNLEIQISSPTMVNLPPTFVIAKEFKKAKIDVQISGISVKRLTEFLNEVHKLQNKFVLTKLEIIQVLGNKLYFNANISFEAYVPIRGSRG